MTCRRILLGAALLAAALAFGDGQQPAPQDRSEAFAAVTGVTERVGLLDANTLFTVYGRRFGANPILGRLGSYENFDEMADGIRPFLESIAQVNGHKPVIPGVHLIYALAVPCGAQGDCLKYLESTVPDIVETYIKPAAQRGWVVVLDTQLGRSDPVAQVKRMIERGYLKYENVHVAIDPEFHAYPGRMRPGIPIGRIQAEQINQVQRLLDEYVPSQDLKVNKVLIVHQFTSFMIEDKRAVKDFPNVELVIDMDGLGTPFLKVATYNTITNAGAFPFIRFRGIKVFFPNPWEKHGHYDRPPMTMNQVFGLVPVPRGTRMATQPNVVIIA